MDGVKLGEYEPIPVWSMIEPPKPGWSFSFDKDCRVQFLVPEGPNAFQRWAQRVFLGIHWKKL